MTMLSIEEFCDLEKGAYPTMKTEPGEYPLVVTAAYRRSSVTYQMEGPAVCVPLISSTGHGDAAIHRVHFQEGKFALANLLVALKPAVKTCNAKYLYYLLSAKKEELFIPLMQGTANVSMKAEDVAKVKVEIPGRTTQDRVVTRIDNIIAKLDEARHCQREIQEEALALLRSACARLTASAPKRKMKEVAPLVRRPVEVCMGEEYPELGVRSFGKGTFHKPALDYLGVGNKKLYRIEPGDLLFNNVFAWEGAIAVAQPEDVARVGSHRFITCVPEPDVVTADFLCFYFLTPRGLEQIGEASPGGAGRNRTLGLKRLAEIEVPVPPFEQQLWFDTLQQRVRDILTIQIEADSELAATLPSVLDRAFKGA